MDDISTGSGCQVPHFENKEALQTPFEELQRKKKIDEKSVFFFFQSTFFSFSSSLCHTLFWRKDTRFLIKQPESLRKKESFSASLTTFKIDKTLENGIEQARKKLLMVASTVGITAYHFSKDRV